MHRRRFVLGGAAFLTGRTTARAQAWPVRPVRILLAYPPGGVSDGAARALAERLALQLGVPVVVENRPGASGSVAMDLLARSVPDGTTLGFAAITALRLPRGAVIPVLPVAGVMHTPSLVVGTPALQAGTLAGMLEEARLREGGIRWATTGEGTTGHLVLERVRQASGAAIVHVPYKGGGQQVNDALGGQFEVLSTNVAAPQLEAIRAGRLKPLAVGAPARLAMLPDVPTLAEAGFPQANLGSLFGLFAPPGTPAAVVARLNAEVNTALRHPALRGWLIAMNNVPAQGMAEDFAAEIERAARR